MPYPWNKIKEIIERIEYDRVVNELSLLEYQDGFIERQRTLTDKTKGYLDFLGKLSIGICVGFFTIMFNFVLFVWLIHVEVNPGTASNFEKKPKNFSSTSDSVIAKQNSSDTSAYFYKEISKESNPALKRSAQYIGQVTKLVREWLKNNAVNFMKDLHSVIDRLKESTGLHALQAIKAGMDVKETSALAPDKRFVIPTSKENIKKNVYGFQQSDTSGTVYTVQVGAFKDYHRADALKRRLIKRGYDAYMSLTGSQSDISIFKLRKVWIGEFTHREEAQRVSSEIGESEGLQAFVTLKKE